MCEPLSVLHACSHVFLTCPGAPLQTILIGNVCQWIIKPLLGLILALTVVPVLGLPHAVGTGVILVSTLLPACRL